MILGLLCRSRPRVGSPGTSTTERSVRRTSPQQDRGETLIELVIAIAILGIAGSAILTSMMISVRLSVLQRNDATGSAYVRSFAEAVQIDVDSNGYRTCLNAVSGYEGVPVTNLPSGYVKSVTAVSSWNGSAWGACTVDGIQRLDLKVTTTGINGLQAEETLTVVLRKPCNGTASTAGADPC